MMRHYSGSCTSWCCTVCGKYDVVPVSLHFTACDRRHDPHSPTVLIVCKVILQGHSLAHAACWHTRTLQLPSQPVLFQLHIAQQGDMIASGVVAQHCWHVTAPKSCMWGCTGVRFSCAFVCAGGVVVEHASRQGPFVWQRGSAQC